MSFGAPQIDVGGILDIAMAGTSATLLARKWESALLVNVDNDTLRRILANPDAIDAVMRIEGFRALGDHIIETVINKSEKVKELIETRLLLRLLDPTLDREGHPGGRGYRLSVSARQRLKCCGSSTSWMRNAPSPVSETASTRRVSRAGIVSGSSSLVSSP